MHRDVFGIKGFDCTLIERAKPAVRVAVGLLIYHTQIR